MRAAARCIELLVSRARARLGAVAARRSRPAGQGRRRGARSARSATRDHQGVVAFCEPYRYADAWELAAGERRLIVCLDGVTDPHNLGAVCRSAEGAGASGVVLPEQARPG